MNKITKYTSLAAVGIMGLLSATSCDDSKNNDVVDYYKGPDAGGVYIPAEAKTSVTVNTESSNYSFLIYRGQANTEITVPVTVYPVDQDVIADAFKFASSVTFAKGELTGPLNFTVDVEMLPEEVEQQFVVEIDPEYTTQYGPDSAIFTITRQGPWTSLGTGYFIDQLWWIDDFNEGTEAEILQSDLNPNLFRIPNPYKFEGSDPDSYIEFQVIQPGETVLGQVVNLKNIVYYPDFTAEEGVIYYSFPGTDPDYSNPEYWTYNFVYDYQDNGLPAVIYLSPIIWYNGSELTNYIYSGAIQIVFPGVEIYDTSIEVTYNGMLTNPNNSIDLLATITLGADVTSAKVAVVPGASASQSAVQGIVDGSISSQEVRSSGDIYISFDPNSSSGKYTIIAVSFIGDSAEEYAWDTFTYNNPNENQTWKSLGYVDYTDAFLCAVYDLSDIFPGNVPVPYSVEIQENSSMPGYYRLVNPYGTGSIYDELGFPFDSSVDSYLYIDATDPDMVSIPESPQTINLGEGVLTCTMMAYYWLSQGYDQSTLIDYGYYGWLEDGVIGFYPTTLATSIGRYTYMDANCVLNPETADEDPPYCFYGEEYNGQYVVYSVFEVDLNNITAQPSTQAQAAKYSTRASLGARFNTKTLNSAKALRSHGSKHSTKEVKQLKKIKQSNSGRILK